MRSLMVLAFVTWLLQGETATEGALARQTAPAAAGQTNNDPSHVALCDTREPGERLTFTGRVLDYGGRPLAKAAVMAYHADRNGLYNVKNAPSRVPRLRGIAITDAEGKFKFTTVKPGAYPDGSEPAHLHVGVMAPAHHVVDLAYWFDGDPLITEQRKQAARDPRPIIVKLEKQADGAWSFHQEIRLQGN